MTIPEAPEPIHTVAMVLIRSFFGERMCECGSLDISHYAMGDPDPVMQVTALRCICVDCEAVWHESVTEAGDSTSPSDGFNRGRTSREGERSRATGRLSSLGRPRGSSRGPASGGRRAGG